MYVYMMSVFFAWIIVKFVGFVWNYAQTCRRVSSLPKLFPQHFFWGFFYKVRYLFTFLKSSFADVSFQHLRKKGCKLLNKILSRLSGVQ